jgi:ribosome-associated protein
VGKPTPGRVAGPTYTWGMSTSAEDHGSLGARVELAPGVLVDEGVLSWAFSRSSGPGGQNVNKVNTRAELRVPIARLPMKDWARERLAMLAAGRIVGDGEIQIVSQEERSQSGNKALCLSKLRQLLVAAMARPKVRRPTKPTRGSKERRLTEKRTRSDIKRGRGHGRGGGED